jgi:hypothetical protein
LEYRWLIYKNCLHQNHAVFTNEIILYLLAVVVKRLEKPALLERELARNTG